MINFAHLHLILVHIPIVLFPLCALLLIVQIRHPNQSLKLLAKALIIGATLFAGGAYLSGGEAEEIVEDIPGISESVIEDHEESAELALIFSIVTAVVAAASLLPIPRQLNEQLLLYTLIIFTIVSSLSFAFVAYQGGKIHHPEAYHSGIRE